MLPPARIQVGTTQGHQEPPENIWTFEKNLDVDSNKVLKNNDLNS